jgi:hypothetical protein
MRSTPIGATGRRAAQRLVFGESGHAAAGKSESVADISTSKSGYAVAAALTVN